MRKFLLLALAAALFIAGTAVSCAESPRAYVRLLTLESGSCSATVIAPERALTAAHCVESIEGAKIGEHAVTAVERAPDKDLATLTVMGLACPCVRLSPRAPRLDETLTLVGYPYGRFQLQTRGAHQGWDAEGRPWIDAHGHQGMSGGGVFVEYLTGEALLIGILTSLTAPYGNPVSYVTP